jgi:ABC-type glycerol-3-phosphate transport system permease component
LTFSPKTGPKIGVRSAPVELTVFLGKYGIEYGKITAAAIFTLIIPVMLVIIFQKYIVE